jgi:phage/plasmid-associated DNA primase
MSRNTKNIKPLGAVPDSDSDSEPETGGGAAANPQKNLIDNIEKVYKEISIPNIYNPQKMSGTPPQTLADLTLARETTPPFVVRTTFREKVSRKFIGCLIKSGKVSSVPYAPNAYQYGKAKLGKEKLVSPLAHLKAYYSLIKGNEVVVKYERSGRHSWGRAYPLGLLSLCGLPREVRNTICSTDYFDFDLSSAHPSIVEAICLAHAIPCSKISSWLKKKEKIRKLFQETFSIPEADVKDCVKDLINSTLYGGGKKNELRWRNEWKLDMSVAMPQFHAEIHAEIVAINKALIKANPVLYDFARHLKAGDQSPDLTFLSYYAQEHEIRITSGVLERLYDNTPVLHGNEEGVAYCEYEYDGFKLRKSAVLEHFGSTDAALEWIHKTTEEISKMKLVWELKPTIPKIDISKELEEYVEIDEASITQQINAFHEYLTNPMGITTDAGLARFVINDLYKDEFLFCKGVWYCWSRADNKWRSHAGNEPPAALNKIINHEIPSMTLLRLNELVALIGEEILEPDIQTKYEDLRELATTFIRCLGTDMKQKAVQSCCRTEALNDSVEFDMNGWLLGFNNGVMELKTQTFRQYEMADKITLTCGFDFDAEYWAEYPFTGFASERSLHLADILKKIFPNEEVRKLVLTIYARSLVGLCLEKFIIFNGAGRNGKGLLDEFVCECLGGMNGYAYGKAPHQIFTQQIKDAGAPNVALASLSKKRLVISKEPPSGCKYDNASVKLITGGEGISATMKYSNDNNTINHGTYLQECNKRPPFKEEPTDADRERILDIEFPCRFTDIVAEVNDVDVFLQDGELKDKLKKDYKMEMIMLLLTHLKGLLDAKMNINSFVPKCVKDRTEAYLQKSFKMDGFMEDTFERMTDAEIAAWKGDKINTPCVPIKAIIVKFQQSKDWFNLSKKEQQKDCYKDKNIKEFFATNGVFRKDYEADWYYLDNGKKTHSAALKWYKLKPTDEVEDEEY